MTSKKELLLAILTEIKDMKEKIKTIAVKQDITNDSLLSIETKQNTYTEYLIKKVHCVKSKKWLQRLTNSEKE